MFDVECSKVFSCRGAELQRLTKLERLKLFYRALADAPKVASLDEARALVTNTLQAVEDTFSGIPCGDGLKDDGRMYAPRPDSRRSVAGRADLVRYRSKKHNTYYSSGGAVLIMSVDGKIEFSKAGADGKEISL